MDVDGDGFAEFFAQHEGSDQQLLPSSRSSQEQYRELWTSGLLVGQTSLSSQGWISQYNLPPLSTQTYGNQLNHYPSDVQGSALDLGPAPNLDYVSDHPVETYIKPAEEGPRLPGLGVYGYARTYAKDEASPAVKSDQGSTLDSAYFSSGLPVGLPKVKRESIPDSRSEYSAVSGAHVSPTAPRPQAHRSFAEDRSTTSGGGKRKRSTQLPPPCPHCGVFQPKNRSDATKHERTHTKPFRCEFAECQVKNVGFSTENDRDRHYKSGRHNLAPQKGAKKGYICAACPPAPGGKPKWWPRQDNFKAHCSRKHPKWKGEELLKELISRSERDTKPAEAYVDDNTTLLSDAGYQQQSLPFQQDHTGGGYDMGHMTAFGQGLGNQPMPFDDDQFLMGMNFSTQPIMHPEIQDWRNQHRQ
ncbi:hypothetical protein Q7P37_005570 [Cladosporium fusiforme]